ncbi:MAG TPA: hypothetical protein VGX23_00255 [Actinocrinis sp.]|nr:hypothetical protein [Actinocrinis sp.]
MSASTRPLHVHHHPPAVTQDELAAAVWADDGGSQTPPSLAAEAREAEWARVSAELTIRFAEVAGREDVIVTALPATRSGAPGSFYPRRAAMEITQALFGPDPTQVHPAQVGDEEGYGAAWGVFTHEGAHAAHSLWDPPEGSDPAIAEAANLLEESRAEKRQADRRPDDRPWLRKSASTLILEEITADMPGDRWGAAHAAGLILARRDGGILAPDETAALERVARTVLGRETLGELRRIWKQAHKTGDRDGAVMMKLGEQWLAAIGTASGKEVSAEELAEAVGAVIERIAQNDEREEQQALIRKAAAAHAADKASEAAAARRSAQAAKQVFGAKTAAAPFPRGMRRVLGTRAPYPAERAAAGKLARALRAAAYRERIETVRTSAAPPGRLSMRGALARDAQRAAGATPTAEPWVATSRRHAPTPPLRIGIAVDISGSMELATGPIASAAWILAKAAASTDPESKTACVAYDLTLTAITRPGRTPAMVTEFAAPWGGHNLAGAIDALDGGLELTRPGTGRLLVIASDGHYYEHEQIAATERITRLLAQGCAVLQIAFEPMSLQIPGATYLELTNPATAPDAIATAAALAIATSR